MSEYLYYTGREPLFGLGYPGAAAGELGSPHDEGVKATTIGRLIGTMLVALGAGIYEGGRGSIVSGDLVLSGTMTAVIRDALGAVPVQAPETTLPASAFPAGVSYVHVQLAESARQDGSCGYYVDASATPAAEAQLVCQVTKADGVLTAVDNEVRGHFSLVSDLWSKLAAALGVAYMGDTPPEAVDGRLEGLGERLGVIESGGGGEGGSVPPSWGAQQKIYGVDPTTIIQQIAADIAAHVAALHSGSSGGTGTTVAVEDLIEILNQSLALLQDIATDNPAAGDLLLDTVLLVPGVREEWVDWEHTTWTTGLSGP